MAGQVPIAELLGIPIGAVDACGMAQRTGSLRSLRLAAGQTTAAKTHRLQPRSCFLRRHRTPYGGTLCRTRGNLI